MKNKYLLILIVFSTVFSCGKDSKESNQKITSAKYIKCLETRLDSLTNLISRPTTTQQSNNIVQYNNTKKEENSLKELEIEIKKIKANVNDYQNSISNFHKSPIIIKNIDFESTNHDKTQTYINYGDTLFTSKIYYLCPRIMYIGNTTKRIKLKMKIIKPNGTISSNSSISPKGFTTETEFLFQEGNHIQNVTGWGNNSGKVYPSGWYHIEFWYSDICVGHKKFYVYDD